MARHGNGIEWTEGRRLNAVTGCDRISAGCDNCYALRMAKRLKAMGNARYQNDGDPRTSGPGFGVTMWPEVWLEPYKWRRDRLCFVDSMADLFHDEVTDEHIAAGFATFIDCPHISFQMLTKRPQRMARLLTSDRFRTLVDEELARRGSDRRVPEGPWPENIWLGVSIENDNYTWRADHLRKIPAALRWICLGPFIGAVPSLNLESIRWVVIDGESGPGARPIDLAWVREVKAQCEAAGIRPFVKQLGTAWARENQ
jgi:protein gp37